MPSWQLHLRNEDWERWTKQPSLAGIDGVKPALGTASCLQHVLNHFHDLRSTLSTILGPNTIPLQPFGFDSMQQCCKVSGLRAASTLAWYICKTNEVWWFHLSSVSDLGLGLPLLRLGRPVCQNDLLDLGYGYLLLPPQFHSICWSCQRTTGHYRYQAINSLMNNCLHQTVTSSSITIMTSLSRSEYHDLPSQLMHGIWWL